MKHFLKTKNCKVTIIKMVTMRLVLLFHECNGLFVIGRDDNPDIFMGSLVGSVVVVVLTLTSLALRCVEMDS